MRPVSSSILLVLLIALCGLCSWQWWRESDLRRIAIKQREDILRLETLNQEQEIRIKAADAEVLRLTGAMSELRSNSVPKTDFETLKEAALKNQENVEKQNAVILQQNGVLEQLNASVSKANDTIKKLAAERDALAQRINEVTEQYNKLAKPAS